MKGSRSLPGAPPARLGSWNLNVLPGAREKEGKKVSSHASAAGLDEQCSGKEPRQQRHGMATAQLLLQEFEQWEIKSLNLSWLLLVSCAPGRDRERAG